MIKFLRAEAVILFAVSVVFSTQSLGGDGRNCPRLENTKPQCNAGSPGGCPNQDFYTCSEIRDGIEGTLKNLYGGCLVQFPPEGHCPPDQQKLIGYYCVDIPKPCCNGTPTPVLPSEGQCNKCPDGQICLPSATRCQQLHSCVSLGCPGMINGIPCTAN